MVVHKTLFLVPSSEIHTMAIDWKIRMGSNTSRMDRTHFLFHFLSQETFSTPSERRPAKNLVKIVSQMRKIPIIRSRIFWGAFPSICLGDLGIVYWWRSTYSISSQYKDGNEHFRKSFKKKSWRFNLRAIFLKRLLLHF